MGNYSKFTKKKDLTQHTSNNNTDCCAPTLKGPPLYYALAFVLSQF